MIGAFLSSLSNKFCADKRATVALMIGILLPVFVGMLGLSVDVTNWYLAKRKLQTAVDSAAIGGGLALYYTNDKNDAENAAIESAERNDFADGGHRTLTINIPPSSGAYAGDSGAVEVIATETQTLFLISVIFQEEVTVTARAVAASVVVSDNFCVLALDPELDGAIEFQGTADVDAGCGIASNSHSDRSISLSGNARLSASPITAVGDIHTNGNPTIDTNAPLRSYYQPFKDPYGAEGLNLQPPASGSCDYNNFSVNNTTTLSPGRYCNGLWAKKGTVTFSPGVYIIDGGVFQANAQASLVGEEVTFLLTGSGNDYTTVWFNGGMEADLSAPTSDPYEGILFYQDQNAPLSLGDNKFLGGADMNFQGAMYFPRQEVLFTGGASINSNCMQIIARKVSFQGNGTFGNNCPADMSMGVIAQTKVKLVE